MKCLDYRRVLLGGTGETQEMRDHRLECVFCTDLHKEHAAFEDELRKALEAPVPAALMMGAMPRAEAARVLADSLPLERIERIGSIRHIAPCPFGEGAAYHVILMVPQDKVTLLVMPDTPMRSRTRATHDGMYASVVPLRKGSVGIVGASAAVVDSVAGALRG